MYEPEDTLCRLVMSSLDLDPSLLPTGTTPLHVAANNKDTAAVSSLLEHPQWRGLDFINKLDKHGRTPLCIALENGRFKVAYLLIKAGASLESEFPRTGREFPGTGRETPGTGRTAIADLLSESAYQPLLLDLVHGGVPLAGDAPCLRSLLHPAAYEGNDELLRRLVVECGVGVGAVDHMSRTALHYASQAGRVSTIELLLECGASLSPRDCSGSTPLHLACTHGHKSALEVLLQEWACPRPDEVLNVIDSRLRTCAHVAIYRKHVQLLAYILGHFRDSLDFDLKDDCGHSLPGLLFLFRFKLGLLPPAPPGDLLSSLPLLSAEEATWTLHSAVHENNLVAVRHCLPLARVDTFDHMMYTPLMLASKLGHSHICEELVNSGADPNIADHVGRTALHCAGENGHFDIVAYLLTLKDISPVTFFESFCEVLSPALFGSLLGCFGESSSTEKPAHWQKWLSLAARNPQLAEQEFSELVRAICPQGWVQVLSGETYKYDGPGMGALPVVISYPCLPPYLEEEEAPGSDRQHRDYACYSYKKLTDSAPFEVRKPRPPAMAFREISTVKKSFNSQKYHRFLQRGRKRRRNGLVYYPLHEAADSANSAFLHFILVEARLSSPSLHDVLLLEIKNDVGKTVVELMARNFPSFQDKFDSSLLGTMEKRFGFTLPEHVTYDMALVHYLVLSREVIHFRRGAFRYRSRTPLDDW